MAVVSLLIFKNNINQGLEYARTVTFLFLSVAQWFNALNCRSEKKSVFTMNPFSNPILLLGISIAILAQIAVMYISFFESIFRFVPVGAGEWGIAVAASFGLVLLIEIDKVISLFFERLRSRKSL